VTKLILYFLIIISVGLNTYVMYSFPAMASILEEDYCNFEWIGMLFFNVFEFLFFVVSYYLGLRIVGSFTSVEVKVYDVYFISVVYVVQAIYFIFGLILIEFLFEDLRWFILFLIYSYYVFEVLYFARPSFDGVGLFKSLLIFSIFSTFMALYFNIIEYFISSTDIMCYLIFESA